MNKYSYNGITITASSKKEAIQQVISKEGKEPHSINVRIYRSAQKVYDIINNKNLILQKNGSIILKTSKRLKESLGIGGDWNTPIALLEVDIDFKNHRREPFERLESNIIGIGSIKLDWNDKKTETIVKNAYNKVKKVLIEKLTNISKEADDALKALR